MGSFEIKAVTTKKERKNLIDSLTQDIEALEIMIKNKYIESSIQRIGAEQEVCFVDHDSRPAPVNSIVLDKIRDPNFTYEHASFNAEINLEPLEFTGECLSTLETNLNRDINFLTNTAKTIDTDVVLVGILPTIEKEHLTPDYFTSEDRYRVINKLFTESRGEPYEFRIEGADQLITRHDNTMFEGCTTSFQVHLQVGAEDFVEKYNWAQAIAGPVLSMATNSPLLLGKRLWRETRIALFQQALDSRRSNYGIIEKAPRVTFGTSWIKESITEIYKDDITRYPVLLQSLEPEDSLGLLQNGEIPKLKALSINNGTVYRWNRGCYGITNGKPHLRIECRYIPSGPTVVDEVANAAFWLGLMNGCPPKYKDLSQLMDFEDVRSNFIKAARMGLGAQFNWINHKRIPAKELILSKLLPIAEEGLVKAGIVNKDIHKYLGIIEDRVRSENTGSQWILDTYKEFSKDSTPSIAAMKLTTTMLHKQKKNIPIHRWNTSIADEEINLSDSLKASQIMSRDLFSVNEEDPVQLASNMMIWKNIRHIPVEDKKGKLKGLITSNLIQKSLGNADDITVKEIMLTKPVTTYPETPITDVIRLMTEHDLSGLPVTKDGYLVGIITERDFMQLINKWLNQKKN
ncbi:MAG: CBS domain-containing protein [Ekhidna sp.]